MKKIRKNTQLSLINPRSAGRPASNDKGIRHTRRERITKQSALHFTIKVRENKADIKNKRLLKILHHAIKRARLKKLKVLHYSLEYNHVHLLVEARDNQIIHQGMQAFGISFAKAINKIKFLKGRVYKNRYHFRKITSLRDYKNVLLYIFRNGIKHKRTQSLFDPYNSMVYEKLISANMTRVIDKSLVLRKLRCDLDSILDIGTVYRVMVPL